jgi:hypothetical protein
MLNAIANDGVVLAHTSTIKSIDAKGERYM